MFAKQYATDDDDMSNAALLNSAHLRSRTLSAVEDFDLVVQYTVDPLHCIIFQGQGLSSDLLVEIHQYITRNVYGDRLLVKAVEIHGPVLLRDRPACIFEFQSPFYQKALVDTADPARSEEYILRYNDRPSQDDELHDTAVLIAIREILVRHHDWHLTRTEKWNMSDKAIATFHNQVRNSITSTKDRSIPLSPRTRTTLDQIAAAFRSVEAADPQRLEATQMKFSKRVEVARELNCSEDILHMEEEHMFNDRQKENKARSLHIRKYYGSICSENSPLTERLRLLREW